MFDALSDRLSSVFDRLGGKGVLSEKDIDEALREVRVALLEADVALPVVRDFIAKAKERATGEAVIRSVKPADQVIKITYDGLVDMLGGGAGEKGGEPEGLNLSLNPPTIIMMAGLQGSGKTTTAGKLALRLQKERQQAGLLPSIREYSQRWGLTPERMALAKPGALVMHPGPMNEGVEIAPEVAHSEASLIEEQVANGVATRMAALEMIARARAWA